VPIEWDKITDVLNFAGRLCPTRNHFEVSRDGLCGFWACFASWPQQWKSIEGFFEWNRNMIAIMPPDDLVKCLNTDLTRSKEVGGAIYRLSGPKQINLSMQPMTSWMDYQTLDLLALITKKIIWVVNDSGYDPPRCGIQGHFPPELKRVAGIRSDGLTHGEYLQLPIQIDEGDLVLIHSDNHYSAMVTTNPIPMSPMGITIQPSQGWKGAPAKRTVIQPPSQRQLPVLSVAPQLNTTVSIDPIPIIHQEDGRCVQCPRKAIRRLPCRCLHVCEVYISMHCIPIHSRNFGA
jgi:hypothetical protein